MDTLDRHTLAPFRRRTVAMGIRATFLVVPALAAAPLLPGDPVAHPTTYWAGLAVTLAGVGIVATLPWDRLLVARTGVWLLYAWSVLDIALIALLLAATDGDRSFAVIFVLTTVFFAASYPRRGQYALFGATSFGYLIGVGFSAEGLVAADAVVILGTLGVAAYMTRFISRELLSQVQLSAEARSQADRRAELLARTAEAARSISVLDPEEVLDAVVAAAAGLGFEAANLDLFDEDHDTYRVAHPRGLPASYSAGSVHPADRGMPGLVRERGETVTVDRYTDYERAVPVLAESDFKSVIASPIWVQGRLAAVLVAGTRRSRKISKTDVEAFDLLAAQAGRAMENAAQFESELQTHERLRELDRLKTDFIANISHELRTPLTVVGGLSSILNERWHDLGDDRRTELLERLEANGDRLRKIVMTLLDFSDLQGGRREPQRDSFDIAGLVRRTVAALGTATGDHEVDVDAPGPLCVRGDHRQIQRVIQTLIDNALTHTPTGTNVTVEVHKEGGDAVVSVVDDGPGIARDLQDHLGERFIRGGDTDTRETRGLGLGLAMVAEILALHDAQMEVDSTPGEGSAFRFRLPLEPETTSVAASQDPEGTSSSPSADTEVASSTSHRPSTRTRSTWR